jgi:hypothetical protein
MKTCPHPERPVYARFRGTGPALCWPCYAAHWKVKPGSAAQRAKDGVWAAYRKGRLS